MLPADCGIDQLMANQALVQVSNALPSTAFAGAKPFPGACLVEIQLESGAVVYSDATGRYFIYGAVIDLKTGKGTEGLFSGEME